MFNVRPYDAPTRVFVSRDRGGSGREHLVDLKAGTCGCEDYVYRIAPIRERKGVPPEKLRCVHIRIAREWFLNLVLEGLDDNGQPRTKTD